MLEDLPPLPFARARRLRGAFLVLDIGVISVHLQYHNAWPAASESSVIQNYREIKTVRAAEGKTEVPRQLNTKIEERLAVALQIHAADFDAGLAALQAADLLTTSATQIAFCGLVRSTFKSRHFAYIGLLGPERFYVLRHSVASSGAPPHAAILHRREQGSFRASPFKTQQRLADHINDCADGLVDRYVSVQPRWRLSAKGARAAQKLQVTPVALLLVQGEPAPFAGRPSLGGCRRIAIARSLRSGAAWCNSHYHTYRGTS
jgi:hypothetical protein